jgi:dipeptidyl aminopeptidase/acylaminoacyl peptidase
MSTRARLLLAALAAVALAAVATTYAVLTASRPAPARALAQRLTGDLVVRDNRTGQLAGVSTSDGTRTPTGIACDRVYTTAAKTVCLRAEPGLTPVTVATLLDGGLKETKRIRLAGVPSRARLSPSGRMVAWTRFTTGDSYAAAGAFSTATAILDTSTGYLVSNIENLALYVDGERYFSPDVNFWGVTFADDNVFYATVATGGRAYLVRGDIAAWTARTIRNGVECPSLSPDGARVAFKKKVDSGWRLSVLDLATMRETPLAEPATVDDQAEWVDGTTVAYARGTDVWTVPADGSGRPHLLAPAATSPSAVHR